MNFYIVAFDEHRHKESLLKLWDDNLSLSNSSHSLEERYNWLYKKNPAGKPTTFLAIDKKGGGVVGCASIFPREVEINKKIKKYCILIDFIVDKKYRVFGPAITLQRKIKSFVENSEYYFAFGYPNKSGEGIFKYLGYTKLGYTVTLSKLLITNSKIKLRIKNKLLSSVISFLLNNTLNIIDRIRFIILKRKNYCKQIEREELFFSTNDLKDKEAFLIYKNNDSNYLKWRYSQPDKDDRFWGLYDKETEKLLGLIIYRIEKDIIIIQDIISKDSKLNKILLLSIAIEMRKGKFNVISLSYCGHSDFIKDLKKLLFLQRSGKRVCYIYSNSKKMKDTELNIIKQKKNWFLFDGELDL